MIGHAIISHGLQSGPDASKATALAEVAQAQGWSCERPDYRDLDASSQLGDVLARIERLLQAATRPGPIVLAGSSMGAFISARVSLLVPVCGLFLMAPPTQLQGYDIRLEAAPVPTRIVHGWRDELIPAADVLRWAQARSAHLVMVDDSHRLADHVALCADEFSRFLRALT
jgi:pimeloyl-ACP methyl ester carboxylesterase